MAGLYVKVRARCPTPAPLEGEAPTGGAGGARVERDMGACLRGDAPAGAGAGHASCPMGGEEKARGVGGLRGEAEAAGGKRGLDLQLGEAPGEHPALQAFFQGPGAFLLGARLDNEEACGVETGAQKARPIGAAPFLDCGARQTPQHAPATICQSLSDDREDEAEASGRVAISVRLDLVEPALAQGGQGAVPVIVGGLRRR